MKSAGNVFFFARSPEAPSTIMERHPVSNIPSRGSAKESLLKLFLSKEFLLGEGDEQFEPVDIANLCFASGSRILLYFWVRRILIVSRGSALFSNKHYFYSFARESKTLHTKQYQK